jgi:CheY-like chemotaxis protein
MLGGKIWLESPDKHTGKGTVFYFTIPLNQQKSKAILDRRLTKKNIPETAPESLKILITEDDDTSFLLLTYYLKNSGHEIHRARTGFEAVMLCQDIGDFDLILMDIKMPVMDGYEATMQIRKFDPDVAIIAQTAYAIQGDREKAIEAGCNDFISKPVSKTKLMEIIANCRKR